jgi:hypothetical protein
MQMVASGTQAWMRNGTTGPYMALPGVGAMMAEVHRDALAGIEAGTGTVELGGTEVVDGRPMTVYRFTTTTPARPPVAEASEVTGRGWIGADGLVHKFEANIARPASHIVMTYEYDDSVSITIPPT